MRYIDSASIEELEAFLLSHPATEMMEVLVVDINGILRGKRIPASEFRTFFTKGLKSAASSLLMDTSGDVTDAIGVGVKDGDPDKVIYPIKGTLATVSWLSSNIAQVFASYRELDGSSCDLDPRNVLRNALQPLTDMGLRAVVATELEFYLLEPGDSEIPRPKLPIVPGTSIRQPGIQYSMMSDLWEHDEFLTSVRNTCEEQNIPATTVHSEFAGGQFEINLHHNSDVVVACDQSMLLKRAIKGCAHEHDLGVTFMAKPFAASSGSGLHIHISLYDQQGNNIFADSNSSEIPPITDKLRHAIGGLSELMAPSMAIYCPNANSYRRLQPESFVPLQPNWGYNHRGVSLRIPVSGLKDTRVEHRVAGADANPYLVMATILAGIHYGLTLQCDPGPMIDEGEEVEEQITLPIRWEAALEKFREDTVLPQYIGEHYSWLYWQIKKQEAENYHKQISPLDYRWYLRAV
ncbi:MAG: glutamine synthetase family protein [Spongiibacteraceae bacterium]